MSEENEKAEETNRALQANNKDMTGWSKPLPEKLPRPTFWPATISLAVTLLFFGVVTHWIISLFGLGLFLLAAGGWFEDLRNDLL